MFNTDLFESNFMVVESTEQKSNGVLAKVKGQFFVPDGISRNKRYYSKSVWEKQLSKPEIQSRLKDRRMFGTISHEQPIDDKALLEGRVSHIVTDLYIDKDTGKGMGEAIILDTPAGRILNTVLRAGGKLFVSSRATGQYKGEVKGVPAVDEDNYSLSTFDYVIEPGFLQANPLISESLQRVLEDYTNENKVGFGENEMDKLVAENKSLKEQIENMSESLDSNKKQTQLAQSQIDLLKEKNQKLEESANKLASYEKLGSIEEINKSLEVSKSALETLEKANAKMAEELKAYRELGTAEEINLVIEKAQEIKNMLEEYQALGSLDSINRVMDIAEKSILEAKAAHEASLIKKLAEELGVEESLVRDVYGKMEVEEIKKFFEKLNKKASSWKPSAKDAEVETKAEAAESKEGSYGRSREMPRAASIMESLRPKRPVGGVSLKNDREDQNS